MYPQTTPPETSPLPLGEGQGEGRQLRDLELELSHKLFEALLDRLDRILARPFDKERIHQLAKLVQVASRLGRPPR